MVTLQSPEQVNMIFSYVANLKGKENVRKKLYFLDRDMDPEEAERRCYIRDLHKENKAEDLKLKIQVRRDKHMVNNKLVTKQVHSPTPTELLKMSPNKKETVMNAKLIAVEEHQEQGSEYYTYVQKVKTFDDVQHGLLKLRIKHGDATHVSCGYRLESAVGPFNQEGHDDKEIGAGRIILKVLKDKGLKNVCIYVVRYYGGIRLGPRRYKILQMLSEAAIATYTFKSRERHQRLFRADSQESILSQISALSYDKQSQEEDVHSVTSETPQIGEDGENAPEQETATVK